MKLKSYRFNRTQFYANLILSVLITIVFGLSITILYDRSVVLKEIIPTIAFVIGNFIIVMFVSPRIMEFCGLIEEEK